MDDINKRLPGRRTSAALSTLDANNFRTFEDSGRYGSAVLIFWPSVLCLDVLCCYMGHVLNCKAPTVPVSRGERPESASHILPRNRSIRLSLYSPPSSYLHPANYHTGIAHHVELHRRLILNIHQLSLPRILSFPCRLHIIILSPTMQRQSYRFLDGVCRWPQLTYCYSASFFNIESPERCSQLSDVTDQPVDRGVTKL